MRLKEVTERLDTVSPLSLSAAFQARYGEYDNPGLLVGDLERDVERILVALDVTEEAIAEARELGASLIVTHHPVIYLPEKTVTTATYTGRRVLRLIESGIAAYAAHVNLDCTLVNDVLAEKLGILPEKYVLPLDTGGLGRFGRLAEPCTLSAFTERVRSALGDKTVFGAGDANKLIETAAVVGGGGGGDPSYLLRARELGADCFVSADFKHHVLLEAAGLGPAAVSCSHRAMERAALPKFAALIKEHTTLDTFVSREAYPYL